MKKKRVFSFLLTLILAFNIGFSFQGSTNVDAASKKYVIKINKQMNCVTIYEKNLPENSNLSGQWFVQPEMPLL